MASVLGMSYSYSGCARLPKFVQLLISSQIHTNTITVVTAIMYVCGAQVPVSSILQTVYILPRVLMTASILLRRRRHVYLAVSIALVSDQWLTWRPREDNRPLKISLAPHTTEPMRDIAPHRAVALVEPPNMAA